MLNSSGDSGHPCHVPDLRGKALSFSPIENDICCGFFIDGFYDIEIWTFWPYTVKSFNQERMLYFVKCFFCIYWEYHMVLVLLLLMLCITLIDLQMLKQLCSSGINPTWSWWIILLMYCCILLANILVRIFHPCSLGILVCNSPFWWGPCLVLGSR